MRTLIILTALVIGILHLASASYDLCWIGDSDCPSDCSLYGNGTENFITVVWLGLGGTGNRTEFQANMGAAEDYMKQFSGVRSTDPLTGLHTTLNYFCCHTTEEKAIIIEVLQKLKWQSFGLTYRGAGCNKGANETWASLWSQADDGSQNLLWSLVHQIEAAVEAAGVRINHPRVQGFHSTLGQVTLDFPIDAVVQTLNERYPFNSQPIEVKWFGDRREVILCKLSRRGAALCDCASVCCVDIGKSYLFSLINTKT